MNFTWASATDTGNVHDHNEDSVRPEGSGASDDVLLVGVADGMGGHVAGEIASRLAIEAAMASEEDPAARVRAGNSAVLDRVAEEPELAGMGTTLTLGRFEGTQATVAHVGDSRAYLFRGGDLIQITRDHSLVAEMVEAGQLRPEDVRFHPYRSVVTRALGLERTIAVDIEEVELELDDQILLCSDGLTEMIPDVGIVQILRDAASPTDAATELVDAANHAGGHDNISVVVVRVDDDHD